MLLFVHWLCKPSINYASTQSLCNFICVAAPYKLFTSQSCSAMVEYYDETKNKSSYTHTPHTFTRQNAKPSDASRIQYPIQLQNHKHQQHGFSQNPRPEKRGGGEEQKRWRKDLESRTPASLVNILT